MSLKHFIQDALSNWMKQKGPESDIVLSSRIRLARNFENIKFPARYTNEEASSIIQQFEDHFSGKELPDIGQFHLIRMSEAQPLEKRVLMEKHLISPNLTEIPLTTKPNWLIAGIIRFICLVNTRPGKCIMTEALSPVPTFVGQLVKYPLFSPKA